MFNVSHVLFELDEVVNWRDVVLHLGVPKHVADHIERDYRGKDKQKKEAISWWIKNNTSASWKELATGLLKAGYFLLATRVMLYNQGL